MVTVKAVPSSSLRASQEPAACAPGATHTPSVSDEPRAGGHSISEVTECDLCRSQGDTQARFQGSESLQRGSGWDPALASLLTAALWEIPQQRAPLSCATLETRSPRPAEWSPAQQVPHLLSPSEWSLQLPWAVPAPCFLFGRFPKDVPSQSLRVCGGADNLTLSSWADLPPGLGRITRP